MEIKDLAGFSEPLTRLIEVISKGVGAVSAPYLTRKNANAKAHEISVVSKALSDVAQQHEVTVVYKNGEIQAWKKPEDRTLVLSEIPIFDRSATRLDYQTRKRQDNVERITSTAALELAADDSVPKECPDDDWISRFFQYAEDVSSEQMQDLWGRILSGEIRRPGKYSLRTLDFVRNMTQAEATTIEQASRLALTSAGTIFIDAHDKPWLARNRSTHPSLVFSLSELNLMYPTDLAMRMFVDKKVEEEHVFFNDQILILRRGGVNAEIKLPIWKFTETGKQLLPLAPHHRDDEYLERLGQHFIEMKAKAFIGQITRRHLNGKIEYITLREITTATKSKNT